MNCKYALPNSQFKTGSLLVYFWLSKIHTKSDRVGLSHKNLTASDEFVAVVNKYGH